MKERYLNKLPDWYKTSTKQDVVLSDDIDGLVSTSALKFAKNWDVEYFYDFETLYINRDLYFKEDKKATRVWADVSILAEEKTFDNHINRLNLSDYSNPYSINPNILTGVTNENYYDKYCGSSALVVWSTYDIPLPELEEGKMLLLAIDSTFKGFYSDGKFKARNRFYLCDVLGFEELYEVEKRHSKNEFYELIGKYNLSAKTRMNDDAQLETALNLDTISELLGIPIVLPTRTFSVWRKFVNKFIPFMQINKVTDIKKVITIAFTGKNYGKYSAMIKM